MTAIDQLVSILDLEPLEKNLWRGISPGIGWGRVFGGQVIAQSLVAANRSVEGRVVHSLHGYFMLPGDPMKPILYEVDRIRDGRSFTTRRVRAIQNGESIFAMMASFHAEEPGLHHQMPMPEAPDAESLPGGEGLLEFLQHVPESRRAYWTRQRPIEIRPCDPKRYFLREADGRPQNIWLRAAGTLPDDPDLHNVVLAYASDLTLLDATTIPHGTSLSDSAFQAASLDHAIWFHEPFRADEWLLYVQDTPWAGKARGLGRGLIYTATGRLVATVAQEGLIRLRRHP